MNCEFTISNKFNISDTQDYKCKKCTSSKNLNEELCKRCEMAFKNLEGTFKCFKCSSTSTPVIRRGPDGLKNLCNKCGLAWKKAQRSLERISISNLID